MLHAAPFTRKKMAKEIHVLDDEMQSRYDKIHGDEGLYCTLVESFNAMGEIRMKAKASFWSLPDFINNLPSKTSFCITSWLPMSSRIRRLPCVHLFGAQSSEGMDDTIWKIEKLDWQAVAERIKAEQKARRLVIPPAPYLDDVVKAADKLGYGSDLDFRNRITIILLLLQ